MTQRFVRFGFSARAPKAICVLAMELKALGGSEGEGVMPALMPVLTTGRRC
jgi:hypothetical protein